uniref:Uncharacterized protein n=1 Tax=viral metagenome TaxID=1070528 RepID=A0A6C0CW87_9ZZZZ
MNLPIYVKRGMIGCLASWGSLGFYRGICDYNYENKIKTESYKIDMIYYENKKKQYKKDIIKYPSIDFYEPKEPLKPNYFYLSSFSHGIFGSWLYICPITMPVCFVKELYRIEINLRSVNDEKNTAFYNKLIF